MKQKTQTTAYVTVELSEREVAFLRDLISAFCKELRSYPEWYYKMPATEALETYNNLFPATDPPFFLRRMIMVEIPTRIKVELSVKDAEFLQYLIQEFRNEPDSHPAWDYKVSTDEALEIYKKFFL